MKKFVIVAAFAIGCCLLTRGRALAQQQDFALLNETEDDIVAVFISQHGDSNWGPNRLNGVLGNDAQTTFTFEGYNTCRWDIAVRTGGGQFLAFQDGLNLCRIYAVGIDDKGNMVTLQNR